MNIKTPIYIYKLIKKFPGILSGRKNYEDQHKRIIKNLDLTKKFIQKNNK